MTTLKIALAQLSPAKNNIEKNIETAVSCIKTASKSDADIIIFPEQFVNCWDPICNRYSRKEQENIVTALKNAACENSVAVLGSYYKGSDCKTCNAAAEDAGEEHDRGGEQREKGTAKENTSVFIDDRGEILAEYSKVHLFSPAGEDRFFVAGDSPAVCSYKGFRFGLTICYDLRFPELFSYYAAVGCNCVINQSAWGKARMEHRDILSKARAVENQYYFIGVNVAGKNPRDGSREDSQSTQSTSQDEYSGGSNVIDPAGGTVLRADEGEGLFFAEIDSDCVTAARQSFPLLSHRRDSLYMEWRRKLS